MSEPVLKASAPSARSVEEHMACFPAPAKAIKNGVSENGNSRNVLSNQQGVHEKLVPLVEKYRLSEFQRPIQAHTQDAFDSIFPWLVDSSKPLILDSCCGVGQSTVNIAKANPHCKVLGVDKSINRIEKHHAYKDGAQNYRVIRADLNDFWRLLEQNNIVFTKHFLLYPNPYPKASQIQKRWHASAVMPSIMALSENIELRSNWRLYLEEFAVASQCYGFSACIDTLGNTDVPFTPFERKYQNSGQTCYRLRVKHQ